MAHTCDPNTWETDAGSPGEFQDSVRSRLKRARSGKERGGREKMNQWNWEDVETEWVGADGRNRSEGRKFLPQCVGVWQAVILTQGEMDRMGCRWEMVL